MLNIEHYEYFQYPCYIYEVTGVIREGDNWTTLSVKEPDGYRFEVEINNKTLVARGFETSDEPGRLRKKGAEQPVDQFHVTGGGRTWAKDKWVKLDTFSSIAEAKACCTDYTTKAHETESPFAFKISKETVMSAVHNYKEWGDDRIASGEWMPTPWAEIDRYPEHYAHMSRGNDGYVAYWATPTEAQKDRLRYESAGSYLHKFYKDSLTPVEIERYVHQMDPPGTLVLSGPGSEDIYNAYRRAAEEGGVSSCMSHADDEDEFCEDNPVRVYGAGDLQVLMLIRRGRAVARALCWPEKKVVGRIYGDIGRMRDAVDADGWTRDGGTGNDMHTSGQGGFNGARVLKMRDGSNDFVAPYIDFMYKLWDDGSGYFIMSRERGTQAHRTDGRLWGEDNMSSCDHCSESVHTDNLHHHDGEDLCPTCHDALVECTDCPQQFHASELTDGRCATCEEQDHDVCA